MWDMHKPLLDLYLSISLFAPKNNLTDGPYYYILYAYMHINIYSIMQLIY